MNELLFTIWLGFGIFCVIAEFLLPGLVIVFIGLGALTVVLGLHLGYIETIAGQLTTFFVSSIVYVFTLRLFLLRLIPTNTKKENVNEDENVLGEIAEVVETISSGEFGRIQHSDSSWKAKANSDAEILKGEKVKIVGRDNITWIVEKI
jgi:membrane protein implicated in regulation of membrane protease activity